MMTEASDVHALAFKRWKILRNAILSTSKSVKSPTRRSNVPDTASVRSFTSFNLFIVSQLEALQLHSGSVEMGCEESMSRQRGACASEVWVQYSYSHASDCHTLLTCCTTPTQVTNNEDSLQCNSEKGQTSITSTQAVVKRLSSSTTLEAMVGFNNTGNVCVWPSEEVLAYYCLRHRELFKGATVCELGCGMTGLAGILLANTQLPSRVLLTDGNSTSIDNVKEIIVANERNYKDVDVSAEVLLWDDSFTKTMSPHDGQFDYVICADCLFFVNVHRELVRVILKLLKPNGRVLMFAPNRGGTLDTFCSVAEKYLTVERTVNYDSVVWQRHLQACEKLQEVGMYNTDLHYPIMLELHKTGTA